MNFPAEIIVMLWFFPVVLQIILPLAVLATWPIVKMLKREQSTTARESYQDVAQGRGRIAAAGGS